MVDIQTERVLEAVIDEVYNQMDRSCRDQCPAMEAFTDVLLLIKHANNEDIMGQIGGIRLRECPIHCQAAHKKDP